MRYDGSSRRRFLVAAASGSAAVAGLAACGGDGNPSASEAPGDERDSDLEILTFLLPLERAQAAFYDAVAGGAALEGRARRLAETFREQEREHVEAVEGLIERLGGSVGAAPGYDFALGVEAEVLREGGRLEDLAVDAYLGQLGRLRRDDVLRRLVSIYTADARHASALTGLAPGDRYTPGGELARPIGMETARERLRELTR